MIKIINLKKAMVLVFMSVILLSQTGCFVRPYNKPSVVQVETNESAFLVDMRSDAAVTTDSMTLIQRKDIIIDGYWIQTGRLPISGHYRPTQRVLVVPRRPVEVQWNGNNGNPVVRAVSSESVGFQVPLVLNATIQTDEDALKYLNWFRSNNNIDGGAMNNVREEAEALEITLNRVVFPVINNVLSSMFLEKTIIEAESHRVEFVKQAFEAAKEEAYKYGITLLILSSTDGLLYDDSEFQNRINQLAVAKMRENVLEQENANALAEQQVAMTNANTAAEVAKIQDLTLDIQRRQMEIEGQRKLYEAEADAIRSRGKNQWPTTLIVQDLDALGNLGIIPVINNNQQQTTQP